MFPFRSCMKGLVALADRVPDSFIKLSIYDDRNIIIYFVSCAAKSENTKLINTHKSNQS